MEPGETDSKSLVETKGLVTPTQDPIGTELF